MAEILSRHTVYQLTNTLPNEHRKFTTSGAFAAIIIS